MKILITSYSFFPDIGGIETVSELLADFFVRQGHQVCVVTSSTYNSVDKFNFSIYRSPSLWQLFRLFQWSDIVFQNNLEVRRLWLLLFIRKPVVIALHTWIRSTNFKRSLIHKVKLLFLRRATTLISCSEAVKQDTHPRSKVIGNPYDDSLFKVTPHIIRKKSIVYLGRLVSDKGVDMLLEAFSCLENKDWGLTIIGDGPQKDTLLTQSRCLNIYSRVNFTGYLTGKNLVEELNCHEIMVVPSLWHEPFGVVALEGMACGCAMLVSDGGGLPEAVGSVGFKFKRASQKDLNQKLQQLVNNATLRQQFRTDATKHLLTHTTNSVGDKYLSALNNAYLSY